MFKMEADMISLASDNYAGAHPEIVAAAGAAATGTGSAYGADPWTAIAENRVNYPPLKGQASEIKLC